MLIAYFVSCRWSPKAALVILVIGSGIFYSWLHPSYLLLIYGSIIFNYLLSLVISKKRSLPALIFGLLINVLLLVVFKYLDFVIENLNTLFSLQIAPKKIPLPLAISFFTFQQIGFLVGIYKNKESTPNFVEYSSFVTFFPQLIAGPIVRHDDYLPQLKKPGAYKISFKNLSVGGTIFIIGLFKKVILADGAGKLADPVFQLVADGITPNIVESWLGVFAYSIQIYFDFSGYSDMAIGLARLFNIRLPINFYSPYKSKSIIEFWRRWHISLSTFLREYIYIPLGGNRAGILGRYGNLLITMLIGGLWHGASWTFVIWGGLHGMYLILNHLLRKIKKPSSWVGWIIPKRVFIFGIVTITWVFFRVSNLQEIEILFRSMFTFFPLENMVFHFPWAEKYNLLLRFPFFFVVIFFLPNVYQWMAYFLPAKDFVKPSFVKKYWFKWITWRPNLVFGLIILIMIFIAYYRIDSRNEFIYFRF